MTYNDVEKAVPDYYEFRASGEHFRWRCRV